MKSQKIGLRSKLRFLQLCSLWLLLWRSYGMGYTRNGSSRALIVRFVEVLLGCRIKTNVIQIRLADAMDVAFAFLLIRSFCEIVIVGQLNRSPGHLTAILRARDVVYGLFSLPLMICIACALPGNAPESHDPLVAQEEDEIDRLTNSILQRLNEITENGRKTAPAMDSFLKTFEKYPEGTNYPAQMIQLTKLDEVRRLMYKYRKWTPIYKWEGPRSESETETPPESIRRMTRRTIRRVDAEDGTREPYYPPVVAVA